MKKPTKATFKSFIRKNEGKLLIKCQSSFDGMTDCVEQNHSAAFRPIRKQEQNGPFISQTISENTLGYNGIWLVGGGRDYFKEYSENGLIGYEVYNSCGNFYVAVEA